MWFRTKKELATIKALISCVRDYRTIFFGSKGEPPLVDNLDGILCSVGPADRVWGFGGDDLLKSGELDSEELRELVHGDISGVLLARAGTGSQVAELSTRWTGIQRRQLESCVTKAKTISGAPGVICVAIGANKARFIFECIRECLINKLSHY